MGNSNAGSTHEVLAVSPLRHQQNLHTNVCTSVLLLSR